MSGATQVIDVLLTVDADYLINNPNGRVENAIAMVTRRASIDPHASGDTGDGGANLWIDVKAGDIIRWSATTLSRNFDRSALITQMRESSISTNFPGSMSDPVHFNIPNIPVPYLDYSTPRGISKTDATYTLWQSTAKNPGKLWYAFTFVLLDRGLNQIGPSYTWDPYITVNSQ
ncbi:AidA/PixA family protein [Pseudomonas purpurea]|uniref:AidA/PixA family protein n=1 Tax=Pseudomonas purpurea TaxID=3136737 RepID=UPI003266DD9C